MPVTFLRLHDRLEIASHLLGEVYSEVFPKEVAGVPTLVALRKTLLARCSALGSQATAEDQAILDMIINACLSATAFVQEEPLTDQQMRIVSQPQQQLDALQKVIAAKTAKGWWKEQRASSMRYAMGDVQHGPHLLRISKDLARKNATDEEAVATWEEFMSSGRRNSAV